MNNNIIEVFEKSLDISKPFLTTGLEESAEIEFKKSLHVKSDAIDKQYLRTIAAFANNSGGTIIFGISPDNNEILGIKVEYENLDNRYFSTAINIGLDGSFRFKFATKTFLGKVVGFLEIEKAIVKPIIIKADAAEFKLGEIYYRYPAQTAKILAADLRRILNEEIASGLQKMIGNISKLVEIGDNAAILDTQSGIIDGGNDMPKFILDEKILENINIIRLGEFVEKEGSPAYVIKGEIETGSIEIIEKTILSNIYEEDIIKCFTSGNCSDPKLMLEKQLSLSSPYFPIHFFIKKLNFSSEEAIEYFDQFEDKLINPNSKLKIKERLKGKYNYGKQGVIFAEITEKLIDGKLDENYALEIREKYGKPTSLLGKVKRSLVFNTIKNFIPIDDSLVINNSSLLTEALSNIKKDLLLTNQTYYLDLIDKINSTMGIKRNTSLKKAICFIDEVYYHE
ncbi:helix-turn-helix domain-containing protein [Pedobacter jeongneungensis]|uniref:AlbA family DNA-binding domain-containing protein n=1 Tax=Pedobacter jeongneungensis TaxID=947309 RepID=UPI000468E583|nr:ATP-binding protein [Pedobacter jeongneungensis]